MYNHDIKQQYLDFLATAAPKTIITVKRLFGKTEEYENKFNKDVYDWIDQNAIEFYISICSKNGRTIYNFNSLLKKYVDWCLTRNLVFDCTNHFYEINDDVIYSTCVNIKASGARILSKDFIYKSLTLLDNRSDRYILLALFEGIRGKTMSELVDVHPNDVDGNRIKLSSGRILTISKELITAIQDSSEEYEYNDYTINGNPYTRKFDPSNKGAYKNYYLPNRLEIPTIKNKAHSLTARILRIGAKIGVDNLIAKSIVDSGRLNMCRQIMDKTGCDLYEALRNEDVVYRYGKVVSISQFKMAYQEAVKDFK